MSPVHDFSREGVLGAGTAYCVPMDYQYTHTDIADLLRSYLGNAHICSLENGMNAFYQNRETFIFPPIFPQIELSMEEMFYAYFDHFFAKFPVAHQILVPMNTGNHWVILQCVFRGNQVEVNSIHSLPFSPGVSEELRNCLGQVFARHGLSLEGNSETKFFRIQPDPSCCGPIVIANLLDLFWENLSFLDQEIHWYAAQQIMQDQIRRLDSRGFSVGLSSSSQVEGPVSRTKRGREEEEQHPAQRLRLDDTQTRDGRGLSYWFSEETLRYFTPLYTSSMGQEGWGTDADGENSADFF